MQFGVDDRAKRPNIIDGVGNPRKCFTRVDEGRLVMALPSIHLSG